MIKHIISKGAINWDNDKSFTTVKIILLHSSQFSIQKGKFMAMQAFSLQLTIVDNFN